MNSGTRPGQPEATAIDRPVPDRLRFDGPILVVGFGITGQAVTRALRRRGFAVTAVDDGPSDSASVAAEQIGVDLIASPTRESLAALVRTAGAVVASPGLPESHPAFELAASHDRPVLGEIDLAAAWDDRPCLAVTGTDGKTTVTTMVALMLNASGVPAVEAGNTEVPLVAAIDDPDPSVFVVEASSFRLAPLRHFRPRVATWLNFAPDHLDVHRDLRRYEEAKANIWSRMDSEQLAVANADDPVVMAHATRLPNVETFSLQKGGDATGRNWHVADDSLRLPGGEPLIALGDLPRSFPHDQANALAAAATALGGGATLEGVRAVLGRFDGLPHRVKLVGDAGGVRWYDDSKATAPHATLAAVRAFRSVVLIAGGRNKGLDLSTFAGAVPPVRAVVAIGEASDEVSSAFEGLAPVTQATSMATAVAVARAVAVPGDAVLLSPGCASFDWYRSYGERGDDFTHEVHELLGARP